MAVVHARRVAATGKYRLREWAERGSGGRRGYHRAMRIPEPEGGA